LACERSLDVGKCMGNATPGRRGLPPVPRGRLSRNTARTALKSNAARHEIDYDDPVDRRPRQGLRPDPAKFSQFSKR
jgi:hypothetical protein